MKLKAWLNEYNNKEKTYLSEPGYSDLWASVCGFPMHIMEDWKARAAQVTAVVNDHNSPSSISCCQWQTVTTTTVSLKSLSWCQQWKLSTVATTKMSQPVLLVTGAAGYVGSHCVTEFLNAGYKYLAICICVYICLFVSVFVFVSL